MNRRNFLKNLGVLLAATQLPTRLLDGIAVAADTIVVNEPLFVTYALGFTITREMLDDDLYGAGEFVRGALAQSIAAKQMARIDTMLPEGTWSRSRDFDTDTFLYKKIHRSTQPPTPEVPIDYED